MVIDLASESALRILEKEKKPQIKKLMKQLTIRMMP